MPKAKDIKRSELNILTDEEIVRMAKEGSGTAYDFLIEKYRGLVKTISRKYYITGGDNEDVIQEGMIGIFKAVRDYDEKGKSSFNTFAGMCIERQIQTAVTGANREKHRILNESLPLYPQDGEDREDSNVRDLVGIFTATGGNEPEKLALIRESLWELRESGKKLLSPMEWKVFDGMLAGKSYKEIAEELNKTPKMIDNAIQRIKKKFSEKSKSIKY